MGALETDYLVAGAGATGLAFTDVLVAETDAEVLLVDRRPGVGGHWNDAYPFVRLHQPSVNYGMPSLPLGEGRVVDGQQERATGAEVMEHFRRGLDEVLLPTGRVRFLGGTEVGLDGPPVLRDLATGETTEVVVRRKLVDATWNEAEVAATYAPSYDVATGADWVRVGDLPQVLGRAAAYVVVGAGKTGMDACLYLLDHGVDADQITWVRPRDPWVVDRRSFQPLQDVAAVVEAQSLEVEALAGAASVTELFQRLEARGRLLRLDEAVEPTAFRCATVDDRELPLLRSVRRVVRLGRVLSVEPGRVVLERGELPLAAGTVVVDCSARGISPRPSCPVFSPDRIVLQYVRQCTPTFSAALIGWVEAHRDDPDEQNLLCPPNPPPSRAVDWLRVTAVTMQAARAWRTAPDLLAWLETCRLDLARGAADHAHEPRMQEAFLRWHEHRKPALERLAALLAE